MASKAAANGGRETVGSILDFGEYRVSDDEKRLFVVVFFDVDSDVFSVGIAGVGLVYSPLEQEDLEGRQLRNLPARWLYWAFYFFPT